MEFLPGGLGGKPPVDGGLGALRSRSKAWTSRQRTASVGTRCLRQERANTLKSISAIPSASSGQG